MEPTLAALGAADLEWTMHVDSVWRDVPHHVPELQRGVHDEVLRAVDQLAGSSAAASPLGLVVIGAGGAGKTHLLTALRRSAVERASFFVLVDMTDVHDFWETSASWPRRASTAWGSSSRRRR